MSRDEEEFGEYEGGWVGCHAVERVVSHICVVQCVTVCCSVLRHVAACCSVPGVCGAHTNARTHNTHTPAPAHTRAQIRTQSHTLAHTLTYTHARPRTHIYT